MECLNCPAVDFQNFGGQEPQKASSSALSAHARMEAAGWPCRSETLREILLMPGAWLLPAWLQPEFDRVAVALTGIFSFKAVRIDPLTLRALRLSLSHVYPQCSLAKGKWFHSKCSA